MLRLISILGLMGLVACGGAVELCGEPNAYVINYTVTDHSNSCTFRFNENFQACTIDGDFISLEGLATDGSTFNCDIGFDSGNVMSNAEYVCPFEVTNLDSGTEYNCYAGLDESLVPTGRIYCANADSGEAANDYCNVYYR